MEGANVNRPEKKPPAKDKLPEPPKTDRVKEKPASEMTADELLAEWDRQTETQEKPPETDAVKTLTGKTPGKKPDREAKPTAADKARETKEHLSNAIDAFKKINEILGEKDAIGNDVDEKKWGLIRPLLKQA